MIGASTTRVKAGQQAQHDEPRPTMNGASHDGIITNVPTATVPVDVHRIIMACVKISDEARATNASDKVTFYLGAMVYGNFKSGSNAGPPSYVSPY